MADSFSPFSGCGPLLLCIDAQPVFLKAIPHSDGLLKRCQFAVEAAQLLNLPVAFTEQLPQKLGGTAPELLSLVAKPTTYAKGTFSALADDGIRDAVRARDAEHLILCGLETSVCIYQTALDALDLNLQVTILSDAVGARRAEDAAVCLDALKRSNVFVLPSETVFYSLLQSAQHPAFKAFTQLVKKYA